MILLALLFLFISIHSSRADQLLWPLPDSKVISGGFADSRPDHFHGGVDLSTQRRSLPVVAPTDGWIERYAVNPPGYGRTLYFRLSDGRTAVFGHLSRFAPALEQMLRDSELAVGTYRVDCLFDQPTPERSFHRGDTLAFSGSTGVGPPHCHFEIREGTVETDPLANFDPPDRQPPNILAIAWTSLSEFSPESGGRKLLITPLGSREWKSPAVRSSEPIAFFIKTVDPGPWGRNAVPSVIRIKMDGKIAYETHPARVDVGGARDVYEKLVWPNVRRDHLDLRRLFHEPPPEEYRDSTHDSSGWLSNLHDADLVIEVEDRAGNVSSVHVNVSAGPWPVAPAKPLPDKMCAGLFTMALGAGSVGSWARLSEVGEREVYIGPPALAFADRLKLTFAIPQDERSPGLFFFQRTGKGAMKPLWCVKDGNDSVSCWVLRAGTYGIGSDHEPPVLTLSAHFGRIHFRLTDALSAVDDGTITCTVDGLRAIAEFEYEERGGDIWTQQPLSRGTHDVVFTAADRAGNSRTWETLVQIP